MAEIEPPVTLDNPANEASKDYVLQQANQPEFDYPQVGAFRHPTPSDCS